MEESIIDLLYRRIFKVAWRRVLLIYCIGGGGQAAEDIQGRMEESMSRYLSIKAALLEPATMEKQTSLGGEHLNLRIILNTFFNK